MRHYIFLAFLLTAFTAVPCFAASTASVAPVEVITLPDPEITGGMPLMEALAARKTDRTFSGREISEQDLSNLLWAAWGINRADGKHTVPTALNRQEAAVYVALKNGIWLYLPQQKMLGKVSDANLLPDFGGAPLALLYAAKDDKYGPMHVGSMYQNAGLYCASAGLNNVVKATGVDKANAALQLKDNYKIFIVHSIGWSK